MTTPTTPNPTPKRKLIEVALPLEAINKPLPAKSPSATATPAPCTCGGHAAP